MIPDRIILENVAHFLPHRERAVHPSADRGRRRSWGAVA